MPGSFSANLDNSWPYTAVYLLSSLLDLMSEIDNVILVLTSKTYFYRHVCLPDLPPVYQQSVNHSTPNVQFKERLEEN